MDVVPSDVVRRRSDLLLVLLSAVVVFYTLGDFVSTYVAMQAGGWERNPIPRFIIHRLGYGWFLVAKLAEGVCVVAACVVLDAEAERPAVTAGWPLLQRVVAPVALGVASLYALLGVYLTVHNTLNYVAMTGV